MNAQEKQIMVGIHTDKEIKGILKNASQQVAQEELLFTVPKLVDRLPSVNDIQDPDKAHELYYKRYNRLLLKYLPKGDDFKLARKIVRDQTKLFLNEGLISGRDSRQARLSQLERAVNLIIDWVNSTGGNDYFELFNKFKEINKSYNSK